MKRVIAGSLLIMMTGVQTVQAATPAQFDMTAKVYTAKEEEVATGEGADQTQTEASAGESEKTEESAETPTFGKNTETPIEKKVEQTQELRLRSYSRIEAQPVLNWKKVKGAYRYRIYRKAPGKKKYKKVATVKKSKRSWTDKHAAVHKTYRYQVKAVAKNGKVLAESKKVKQKAKKTVLVGDSTMRAVREYYVLPKRYTVTKIGVNTHSFMTQRYADYSINGSAATGINKLISLHPDRIFIMMGMNELAWTSVSGTVKGYEKIIKRIKKKLPKAEVVIMATSPTSANPGRGTPSNGKINRLNKALKKMAKRRKVSYYAWSSAFKNKKGYLKASCNDGDGCHWTIKGARIVVKSVRKYTKKHP